MSDQTIETASGERPTEIMAGLRDATSEHHRRAEGRGLQQALVKGELPRETFAAYLAELFHVHSRLELRLRESAEAHPAVRTVFQPHCERESDLRADLDFMGHEPGTPLPATSALLDDLDRWAKRDPVALLGPLYVLEGSMNGNLFIARVLMKAWNVAPGPGLKYLNPYGTDQKAVWTAFKDRMDGQELSADERAAIIGAAQRTFDGIAAIADAVHDA
jgi:heme oxygenase